MLKMLKYDCTVLHLNKNKPSWEKNKILGFKAKFRSSINYQMNTTRLYDESRSK